MGKTKRQILIVEDNGVQSMLMQQFVEELDHEVIDVVDKGEKAIAKTRDLDPDLILMDVFLNGDMTGIEAMRVIRQTSEVPVIYISGNSDPFYVHKARQTGCEDFLFKPLSGKKLKKAVERALTDPGTRKKSFLKKMAWPLSPFF